jgi:hypothetical protein
MILTGDLPVCICLLITASLLFGCAGNDTGRHEGKADTPGDTVLTVGDKAFNSDSIKGDFDGDEETEYAWLRYFELGPGSCDNCDVSIRFSDTIIPYITLDLYAAGGTLISQGDIDENGADDFSVAPFGDASEWSTCIVYSFRNGKWTEPLGRFPVFGAGGDHVEKDSASRGYVWITEYVFTEAKVVASRARSVKLE